MKLVRILVVAAALLATALPCQAQQAQYPTAQGHTTAPGYMAMCLSSKGVAVPFAMCDTAPAVTPAFRGAGAEQQGGVISISPNSGAPRQYSSNAIPITGNGTGTTGAVVGTLAASPGRVTYICGVNVSAIGGTAAVGPITVAGLVGSSMVFQLASSAGGSQLVVPFTPCIPASAINTAITVTTTADGTATGVDVNSWGFQQ